MKDDLFAIFKLKLVRKAKDRQVKLLGVKDKVLTLEIDGQHVKVEQYPKGGYKILCSCDCCGAQAEANNVLCSRKIKAIDYMIRHPGDISEIEIERFK